MSTDHYADLQILREVLTRELATVNQYEQLAAAANSSAVKALLEHLLYEEKEHIAELFALLEQLDRDQRAHFLLSGVTDKIANHDMTVLKNSHAAKDSSTEPKVWQPARLTVGSLLGQKQ
ncbi:MAG: hypothetical protein HY692_10170 [Cyanobacteria bacterium NC_groundwater_1444_Ag_S-0.65um_54_12]|nr:hypothetical protein [Cyanobacteria bacterium NC_groundwater_1444_Ag_S-0.65um_54_12]